jgi:uncharacterized protein
MAKNVLITGASGLVGSRLTEMLQQKGYHVSHLSRNPGSRSIPTFIWDVEKETVDDEAFKEVDAIIHLAGAGVADKRWTVRRKREIMDSRVKSSRLLYRALEQTNHRVQHFIAASAVGYYGLGNEDRTFKEEDSPGDDFLANVVRQWESETEAMARLHIRVVKLRIGVVLSEKGGALAAMARPVYWGAGAPLGSGDQWISWIHLDDLCGMFIHALENQQLNGAYNAVASEPVTNRQLTIEIAKALGRRLWLPKVPSWLLKLLLGEMSFMVVEGSRVSSAKMEATGFTFRHTRIRECVEDLLGKKA